MLVLLAAPLLIAGLVTFLAKAWAALRGIVLVLLALASVSVAYVVSPLVYHGHSGPVTGGPLSSDAGEVLIAVAVALTLFGLWQLLEGIVRLARRGPTGAGVALVVIGCLVLAATLPLLVITTAAPTAAAV